MNFILSAFIIIIAFCWSIFTSLAGLFFIPILLIMAAIGFPSSRRSESSSVVRPTVDPYYVHVPIQSVPQQYYAEYSAYLKSPEWRSLRKLVLKRDRYRCTDCGTRAYHMDFNPDGEKLVVHHLHYDGIDTMTFTADQCVALCHRCHDIRHGR